MPLDFTRRPKKRRFGVVKLLLATALIVAAGLLPPALLAADRDDPAYDRVAKDRLEFWP